MCGLFYFSLIKLNPWRESPSTSVYGYRWQKARESYLKKNRKCAQHLRRNVVRRAVIVDHKIPHRLSEAIASGDQGLIVQAERLFWDRNNWQALCKLCHDGWKQRLEKSGVDSGCDESGIPIDTNHHWNCRG